MTLGWKAFDARTVEALRALERRGTDVHGERITVALQTEPVLAAIGAQPMREVQLRVRLKAERRPLIATLETLELRGLAVRDDEGFWRRAA